MTSPQRTSRFRLPGKLERYREMAGDVAWSGMSDIAAVIGQAASFILLLEKLPLELYGGYVGLYGIIGPIGALSWSGLALLVMQQIVREKDDPETVGRSVLTMIMIQGLLACLISMWIADQVIASVPMIAIALLIVVDLIITPLVFVTASFQQAIISFPAAAKTRIVLVVLRMAALVALWFTDLVTLPNLATAWIVVLGLLGIYCLAVLWPRMGLKIGFAIPRRDQWRANLQLSFPLASSNLQKDGDKTVLNYYGFATDAGIYGAAFRIVWMAQTPIQSLNNALFHRFLENDESVSGQHVGRAKRFTVVAVGVSMAVAVVIFLMAPVLPFFLGDKFEESVDIVRLLSVLLPLIAFSQAPLNGLLGLNATGTRAFIVLSSAAVAMTLYITLIPSMSFLGAVIGTIVAEAYLGAAGWFAMIRIERRVDAEAASRPTSSPQVAHS